MADAEAIDGHQLGDPKKMAKCSVDVVRSEGLTAGREMPKRFPLGTDVLDVIWKKCEETLMIRRNWEDVMKSTDF